MMKKVLVFWGCFCLVFVAYLYVASNPRMLSQDSGWDYDYDSGSSSDYSSSSSRDSSYDRYDHSSSGSYSSSSGSSGSSGGGYSSNISYREPDPFAEKIVDIMFLSVIGAIAALAIVSSLSNAFSRGWKRFIKDSLAILLGFGVMALMFFGSVLFALNGHPVLAFIYFFGFPSVVGLILKFLEKFKHKKEAQARWERMVNIDMLSDAEIKALDPSIDSKTFMKDAFELYKKIQIAWMNFDYDALRDLLSDELYNQYKMQLEVLASKKQQNIMSDFKYISGGIISIKKTDLTETINIKLNVVYY